MSNSPRVLIACVCSQVECLAFRSVECLAWSIGGRAALRAWQWPWQLNGEVCFYEVNKLSVVRIIITPHGDS